MLCPVRACGLQEQVELRLSCRPGVQGDWPWLALAELGNIRWI